MADSRQSVAIVTLSFNQREFLEEAILSVLGQDHPVEYIVVDAGSTDGSRDVIEAYRSELAHVVLEPDDGPADGLNKALALAGADLFGCVNSSDVLLPGAVAGAVAAFERWPRAGAVYGDGYLMDEAGRPTRRFRSTPFGLRAFAYRSVDLLHPATFVRRSAALEVGGYNRENRTGWDGELLVDLAMAGHEVRHVSAFWGGLRRHGESITGSDDFRLRYERDRARLFEKIVGRTPGSLDQAVRAAARVAKCTRDPRYLAWRAVDAVRAWPPLERAA